MTWREFAEKNNPGLFDIPPPPASPSANPRSSPIPSNNDGELELAVDLLEKLLDPESTQRITARDALYHPFLAEFNEFDPGEIAKKGDDAFFPHPAGTGVCSEYHHGRLWLYNVVGSFPQLNNLLICF